MNIKRTILKSLLLAVGCAIGLVAGAQEKKYPSKPIRLVVPFAAGGGTDVLARVMAEKLRARLGQQVLVDNRPGAATLIGAEYVGKQPPDGYTLLMTANSTATLPALFKRGGEVLDSVTPVAPYGQFALALFASPKLGVSSVAELVSLMKASPGKLNFATTGIGTSAHLAWEAFAAQAGVKATVVPYKGDGPIVIDLMSGDAHVTVTGFAVNAARVAAGEMKVLALFSDARSPYAPQIPTFLDAGYPSPELATTGWYAIFAPKGTPKAIMDRLNREIVAAANEPDILERFKTIHFTPFNVSQAQLEQRVKNETTMFGKAIKDLGIEQQ